MTARRFTNALSPWTTWGTAAIFAAAAFPVAVQATWLAGAAVAAIGAALAAAVHAFRPVQTIVIDEIGVTVLTGNAAAEPARFTWGDVLATRYEERPLSVWDRGRTVAAFRVEGASGTLLSVNREWRDFDGIIAACNDGTPHLLNTWAPDRGLPRADILERSGTYCRVARRASHYTKLPPVRAA